MDESRLYFIAIRPGELVSNHITAMQREISQKYFTQKALSVFPHITLVQPFKRFQEAEVEMHLNLERFFSAVRPLEIKLSGMGCFNNPSGKVIFINVKTDPSLMELHKQLAEFLRKELKFTPRESSLVFHPHITLAYRDLTAENFRRAWPLYENKSFEASFKVQQVGLYKHDFRQWQLLSTFLLTAT